MLNVDHLDQPAFKHYAIVRFYLQPRFPRAKFAHLFAHLARFPPLGRHRRPSVLSRIAICAASYSKSDPKLWMKSTRLATTRFCLAQSGRVQFNRSSHSALPLVRIGQYCNVYPHCIFARSRREWHGIVSTQISQIGKFHVETILSCRALFMYCWHFHCRSGPENNQTTDVVR